jgi:hypothetical protein
MVPIILGFTCQICQKVTEMETHKPMWAQPRNVKFECPKCKTLWNLKLIRVQGEVAKGEDVDLFQSILKLGAGLTPGMIKSAIERGKGRKSLITKLKEKVGL